MPHISESTRVMQPILMRKSWKWHRIFETFQPDLMAFEKAINEKTKAVIVNTPNNPTGVIYHEETMKKMAEILEKKEKEIGHEIYLISDEPYRELVYDGNQRGFPDENTIGIQL